MDEGAAGMDIGGLLENTRNPKVDNFNDMRLHENLLRGIKAYGIEKPSRLDQQAIVPCCEGRDLIARVQSDQEAMTTFAIVLLQQLATKTGGADTRNCQTLVLAKSRETAHQVTAFARRLCFRFCVVECKQHN
ncbi:eukaryotic initiation factor 4A-like [Branchiostoma lanceolatum]|uniref:eukaryotic initiation factor 4A-like n=1 Tax=Branchiostoma lanceolatum TaxID=7740 RepID=UPI0034512693